MLNLNDQDQKTRNENMREFLEMTQEIETDTTDYEDDYSEEIE